MNDAGSPTEPADAGSGGLDKSVIMEVIHAHTGQIKFCYERELQDAPTLKGNLKIHWLIGPDGSVKSVDVIEKSIPNDAVIQCVVGQVKKWKFPAPEGGGDVNVTFPWVFTVAP